MYKSIFSSLIKLAATGAFLCAALPANAAVVGLETTNASGWLLENYTPGPIVIWHTGAACANGATQLYIANPAPGDLNRLWSVVTAAKAAGTKIFIRYDDANCTIASFGFAR